MKFTMFAIIVALIVFVGYFSVNYAVNTLFAEQVVLEDANLPKTNLYPTALMFLAQQEINNYNIKDFRIQIQDLDFDELRTLETSMLIIDPEDNSGDIQFTKQQIKELKRNKKYVIAYIDIAEAENWRNYYDELPEDILGAKSENYSDVYNVAFWQPYWKELNYKRVNDYLTLGYDGVYLDGLDSYKYWQSKGISNAKQNASNFLEDISIRVKAKNQNLLVIPENGLELLKDNSYINYIDGVAAENVFFRDNEKNVNRENDLEYLRYATSKGKFVLTFDYSKGLNNRCNFINLSKANNFVPFVSTKDLDSFVSFTCDAAKYSQ